MLTIENTDVYGFEPAFRGLRNPKNSWDKSDTKYYVCDDYCTGKINHECNKCVRASSPLLGSTKMVIGDNDMKLAKKMNVSTCEAKYRRMINVTCDVCAPLYFWKEYDTYKVGTVANSCSTMHKIHAKEFTLNDFSCEHLNETSIKVLKVIISQLNTERYAFIKTEDKKHWWQMIQLLPSSYNQKRTIQLNYEVLSQIYHWRKNHKLDEWHTFCDWITTLPYSELITGEVKE